MSPSSSKKPQIKQKAKTDSSKRRLRPSAKSLLAALAVIALGAVLVVWLSSGEDEEPTVPPGAIAVIEHAPDGIGEITEAEFERRLAALALANGLDPPKPGEAAYEELGRAAVETLIERVWVVGQAEELGLALSDQELAAEVAKAKSKYYDSEADFREGLRSEDRTLADFELGIKKEALDARVQDWLKENPPKPSQDEIEEYYAEYEENFEPEPGSVRVSLIRNKDRAAIEQAKHLLEKALESDELPWDAWDRVAKRFSEEPGARDRGAEQSVVDGDLEEPLNAAVFKAPEIQLEGPIKTRHGFVIFERDGGSLPTKLRSLDEMEGEIRRNLAAKVKGEFISEFSTEFNERWGSRTYCAPDYGVELCANYDLPLGVGDCITGGEVSNPDVVPCSTADFKIVSTAESTDDCEHEGIELDTRIGKSATFCVVPLRKADENEGKPGG